jgi:hypothetical protein
VKKYQPMNVTLSVLLSWIKTGSSVRYNKTANQKITLLIVLPPGMPAFCAPEEPDFAFICGPQLPKPPARKVIVAFRAPDLDGWQCPYLLPLFHNHDLLLAASLLHFHLVIPADIPDISAFFALELTPRRY